MISEGKVAPCSLGRKQLLATGDVPGQQCALLGCDNGRNWREELQGNSRGTVRQREGNRLGLVPRLDGRRSKENRVFGGGGVPETCGEDPGPCRRKGAKSESGFSFFFIYFFFLLTYGASRGMPRF